MPQPELQSPARAPSRTPITKWPVGTPPPLPAGPLCTFAVTARRVRTHTRTSREGVSFSTLARHRSQEPSSASRDANSYGVTQPRMPRQGPSEDAGERVGSDAGGRAGARIPQPHGSDAADGQGLTLVHISFQPKPSLSHLPVSPCLIDYGEIMHPNVSHEMCLR